MTLLLFFVLLLQKTPFTLQGIFIYFCIGLLTDWIWFDVHINHSKVSMTFDAIKIMISW